MTSATSAAEITITSVSDTLINYADQAIAQGKVSVDKLLTVMQTIHENQKSELKSALEQGNLVAAQNTLNQRNQMYPLTTHLYTLKAGEGKSLTNASGATYTFKQQAPLPRLNLSRGEDEYYSFPQSDTFLELQRNLDHTGAIYNEVSLASANQSYFPTYFYAGNNTLQNLTRRGEGAKITELPDEEIDIYCFYDMPFELMTTQDFSVTLTNGANVAGKDIYTAPSYSPDYYLTSLDKGFQFCQKVSAFIGATSSDKEYPAQECLDAANGKFYKDMHQDILAYALDYYL